MSSGLFHPVRSIGDSAQTNSRSAIWCATLRHRMDTFFSKLRKVTAAVTTDAARNTARATTKSSRSPSGCIARRSKPFPTSQLKICNAAAPLPTALPSQCGSGCAPWWSTKSIIAARFIFIFRCSKRRLRRSTDSLPSKSGSAALGVSELSLAVCRQYMAASVHRAARFVRELLTMLAQNRAREEAVADSRRRFWSLLFSSTGDPYLLDGNWIGVCHPKSGRGVPDCCRCPSRAGHAYGHLGRDIDSNRWDLECLTNWSIGGNVIVPLHGTNLPQVIPR